MNEEEDENQVKRDELIECQIKKEEKEEEEKKEKEVKNKKELKKEEVEKKNEDEDDYDMNDDDEDNGPYKITFIFNDSIYKICALGLKYLDTEIKQEIRQIITSDKYD